MDTTLFAGRSKTDETGCPAYDPQSPLQVILLAEARGLSSSRTIAQACREDLPFMAVACGQVPDHGTLAAFVASLKAESTPLFRAILLVRAAQDL
jgi:transposase